MRINPKQMERMARQMGMKMDQIEADEVIIRGPGREIVIRNPSVTKVNMGGQETYQVVGDAEERDTGISEEDVRMVSEKTGVTEDQARQALEGSNGDLAEAIMKLKS